MWMELICARPVHGRAVDNHFRFAKPLRSASLHLGSILPLVHSERRCWPTETGRSGAGVESRASPFSCSDWCWYGSICAYSRRKGFRKMRIVFSGDFEDVRNKVLQSMSVNMVQRSILVLDTSMGMGVDHLTTNFLANR